MSKRHKKTAVRWLSTLVAFTAVAIMLFPILDHRRVVRVDRHASSAATSISFHTTRRSRNYKAVILGTQSGPAAAVTTSGNQLAHVLTSLEIALATALLTVVISVPAAYALAKYRMRITVFAHRRAAPRSDRSFHRLGHVTVAILLKVHLVNTLPGVIIADGLTPYRSAFSSCGLSCSVCPTS